jgi:hypothetical protein
LLWIWRCTFRDAERRVLMILISSGLAFFGGAIVPPKSRTKTSRTDRKSTSILVRDLELCLVVSSISELRICVESRPSKALQTFVRQTLPAGLPVPSDRNTIRLAIFAPCDPTTAEPALRF